MKTLTEFIKERIKEKKKEEVLMKKKYASLGLVERNAYDSIIERAYPKGNYKIILLPFKFCIYLALFGLAIILLFDMNILAGLGLAGKFLLDNWWAFAILAILFQMIDLHNSNKLKRKLLLKKWNGGFGE